VISQGKAQVIELRPNRTPEPPTQMISALGVEYAYPSGRRGVSGIDLEVHAGERVLVLGPNGAGKSTLIQILAGLTKPRSGTISVLQGPAAPAHRGRTRVGVALDRVVHWEPLTALENVVLLARAAGLGAELARREGVALLERFGVEPRLPVRECSLGMKRKVLLAQALVHAPELVLLDEPTLGLDPPGVATLAELLRERAEGGAAMVLASNDVRSAPSLGTRVVFLMDGRKVADEPLDSLLAAVRTGTRLEVTLGSGGTRPEHLLARRRRPVDLPLTLRGEAIVAESRRGAEPLPDLLRWLLSEGAEVRDVHVREPDLSDVFQTLTGRSWERDA
jgi:ABC-2 type transport system ATP-binding protein